MLFLCNTYEHKGLGVDLDSHFHERIAMCLQPTDPQVV